MPGTEHFKNHIVALCNIIAPNTSGAGGGPDTKDTGVAGAVHILDTSAKVLYNFSKGGTIAIPYHTAEALITAAYPDNLAKQNTFRAMEGYPARPLDVALQIFAQEAGVHPAPTQKECFDAIRRLKEKTFAEIAKETGVSGEILQGRTDCDEPTANQVFERYDFGKLGAALVQTLRAEIALESRRRREFGPALHAMFAFSKLDQNMLEITEHTLSEDLQLGKTTIRNWKNNGTVPAISTIQRVVAFFSERCAISTLFQQHPFHDENSFYDFAEQLREKYPNECQHPNKPLPSAAVRKWGRHLDALIHTLKITEGDIAKQCALTQKTINFYRNARTVSGPGEKKQAIQHACGCDTDTEFTRYGEAAQRVLEIRAQHLTGPNLRKLRQEKVDLYVKDWEKLVGTKISDYEIGTRTPDNPEALGYKLGLKPAGYWTQKINIWAGDEDMKAEQLLDLSSVQSRLLLGSSSSEFLLYQAMGIRLSAEDKQAFNTVASLRERVQKLYPHREITPGSRTGRG